MKDQILEITHLIAEIYAMAKTASGGYDEDEELLMEDLYSQASSLRKRARAIRHRRIAERIARQTQQEQADANAKTKEPDDETKEPK